MTDKTSKFIPGAGDLFYAEKKPLIVEEAHLYDRATGKVIKQCSYKHDYSQRAVMFKCTSRCDYMLVATNNIDHSNRVAFVIGDWNFYPVHPDILKDIGMGRDGHPLPPGQVEVRKSSDREITEGVQ